MRTEITRKMCKPLVFLDVQRGGQQGSDIFVYLESNEGVLY